VLGSKFCHIGTYYREELEWKTSFGVVSKEQECFGLKTHQIHVLARNPSNGVVSYAFISLSNNCAMP